MKEEKQYEKPLSVCSIKLQQFPHNWHWYAMDEAEIVRHGWAASLWDAVNDAYRALKEELSSEGGTRW